MHPDFGRNCRPTIGDGKPQHVVASLEAGADLELLRARPLAKGLFGADQEVAEHAADLVAVGGDRGQAVGKLEPKLDTGRAKFSMPGMMDTVLDLGLTDETAAGMVKLTGNPRFVYDNTYRRLVEMLGTVVLGIPDEAFEEPLKEYKSQKGYKLDTEMTADDWKAMVSAFREVVKKHKGFDFPQDPFKQLELATENRVRVMEWEAGGGLSQP